MSDVADKGAGRGRGPETAKGKLKFSRARLDVIEAFLAAHYPGEFEAAQPTGTEDTDPDEEGMPEDTGGDVPVEGETSGGTV